MPNTNENKTFYKINLHMSLVIYRLESAKVKYQWKQDILMTENAKAGGNL